MPWSARGWWRAPAVYLAASMASTTKRQKNSEENKFQVTGRDKRAEESVLKDSENQTNQIRRERAIRATAGSEQGGCVVGAGLRICRATEKREGLREKTKRRETT